MQMSRPLIAIVLLLLCGGCLFRVTPARTELVVSRVVLPFTMDSGSIVIPVTLPNGTWPMTLDTSQPGLVISSPAAGRIGPANLLEFVEFDRVLIGGAILSNVRALLNDQRVGGNLGGIVGVRVFDDVLLTIDGPARKLVLEQGSLPAPDGNEILPFRADGMGRPSVELAYRGRREWASISTGVTDDIIIPSDRAADFPGMARTVANADTTFFAGVQQGKLARLSDELTLAGTKLRRMIVHVDDKSVRNEIVLGNGLLSSFVVTIDQQNHRIRFHLPGPAAFDRKLFATGFQASRRTGEVVHVRAGGPAGAAGMKKGDHILQIAGRSWQSIVHSSAPFSAVPESLPLPILVRDANGGQRLLAVSAEHLLP